MSKKKSKIEQISTPPSAFRVDFDQKLHNLAGIPLEMDGEPVTLKLTAITALTQVYPDDNTVAGDLKYLRYALAKRIYAGAYDFTPSDVDTIKKYIGRAFVTMVVGPAFDALDGVQASASPSECAT